jgi:hypothetical protein
MLATRKDLQRYREKQDFSQNAKPKGNRFNKEFPLSNSMNTGASPGKP